MASQSELEFLDRSELAHECWVAMRAALEPIMPGSPVLGESGWRVVGNYRAWLEAQEAGI